MHRLHIKIDPVLKRRLKKKAIEMKMSMAKLVRFIFKKSEVYLEFYLCTGEQEGGQWERCNGCADLTVRITPDDHRKLKTWHSSLDTYSMAQIVRRMIVRFLDLLKKTGRKRLEIFVSWFSKRWKKRLQRMNREIKKNKFKYRTEGYLLTLCRSYDLIKVKILE